VLSVSVRAKKVNPRSIADCGLKSAIRNPQSLHLPVRDQPGEVLKRSVEGSFGLRGVKAGREFPVVQVILKALAAIPLPRTGFVAAVAVFGIPLLFAFHSDLRFEIRDYRL